MSSERRTALTLDDFKTLVDIIGSFVTMGAIFLGGGWFLLSRSLAGKLEATMTLASVTVVNDELLAIVDIHLKNVGQTRIRKQLCVIAAEAVLIPDQSDPNITVTAQALSYDDFGLKIFKGLPALEPGEETGESVALRLQGASLIEVGLRFTYLQRRWWSPWQATPATWEWNAFYSATTHTPPSPPRAASEPGPQPDQA